MRPVVSATTRHPADGALSPQTLKESRRTLTRYERLQSDVFLRGGDDGGGLFPPWPYGLHYAEARRWIERLLQQGEMVVTDDVSNAFEVRRIAVEERHDLDTYVVGIAENEDGGGDSLLLQTA